MDIPPRRIALVHDFLYTYGGAERVLEQILRLYPDADLFALFDFLPAGARGFLQDKPVQTSFIQNLPLARRRYRSYLPLMPMAIEQLDVSAYDLVISSSYVVAKGVITRPDQLHICYCHTPARFAWDMQRQYLAGRGLKSRLRSLVARPVLHYIRNWDQRTANGVDVFVANSRYVGRRIEKAYRRPSTVVYPPVDVEAFIPCAQKEPFYVTASRLVAYKRIDLVIEAFNRLPHRRLYVIGDGPEFGRLKTKAGANVELLGHEPFLKLRDYMQRARAFVFAAEEDFGILPVEAQACGTPVIAYGRGGVTESVIPGVTGLFFKEQNADSLIEAVLQFESQSASWDAQGIRSNAERFCAARFRQEFSALVERHWQSFSWRLPDGASSHSPAARSEPSPQRHVASSGPRQSGI